MTFRPLLATLPLSLLVLIACQPTAPLPETDGDASSSLAASPYARTCEQKDFEPDEQEPWNTDAPTTTVIVDRPVLGFRAEVPYNPAWGSSNKDCQLTAFDEFVAYASDEKEFSFGYANIFEGGGIARFNTIRTAPKRTADEVVAAALAEQRSNREQGMPDAPAPLVRGINGNTVVTYASGIMCVTTTNVVIGSDRNYEVYSTCDIDMPGVMKALEALTLY